jgi:hypothetical protein
LRKSALAPATGGKWTGWREKKPRLFHRKGAEDAKKPQINTDGKNKKAVAQAGKPVPHF